jgi:pimeloyl-ACP methyl ester carboxylesterase
MEAHCVEAELVGPPSGRLLLSEARVFAEFGAFLGAYPLLRTLPEGDGHPVLIFPGFVASDVSTAPLRTFLHSHGYAAHGWNLGRNLGLKPGLNDAKLARLKELHRHYGRKVTLIGWSLGGIYARELAKRVPDDIRMVISLGSPFRGHSRSTHVADLYERLAGHSIDEARARYELSVPPPVPTTAIFSRTDGIVAWQTCVETPGPQTENIEIRSSHIGMGHHPAALFAIADRLAQPEDTWKPFDRSGLRSLFYPAEHGTARTRHH